MMSAEVIKMSNSDKDRNVALESAIGQIDQQRRAYSLDDFAGFQDD